MLKAHQEEETAGYRLDWSPTDEQYRTYLEREVAHARVNLAVLRDRRVSGTPTLHSHRTVQQALRGGA